MVEHVDIPDGERHEPKGADAATAGQVYVADGSNSGNWRISNPYGGWRYSDIGTGETFTTPTSYTLMDVAGTTTNLKEFSHNSLGRLTYTGSEDTQVKVVCELSFAHSTGSGANCFFEWYKNGVAQSSEMVVAADSTNYQHISLNFDDTLSEDDYVEVFIKTASGDITVHSAYMYAIGVV